MSVTNRARRLLIVTAWYPPEHAPFGQMMRELAVHLASRGFTVDVITSVPNHPGGFAFDGWRNRLLQEENDGPHLRVLRIGILPRLGGAIGAKRSVLSRALGFLWFTVASFFVALRAARPDVVFAVLQPLSMGPLMILLARLKRCAVIFSVQDLHPDALVALGLVHSPWLIALLRRVERLAYRKADALAVISEGFRAHCIARGADRGRIEVIPNWIDLDEVVPRQDSRFRERLGLSALDFVVLYAGTVGLVSGARVVLDAADLLRQSAVHFAFVGDGPLVPELRAESQERGLSNVHFLPFQPRELLSDVQSLGDVSIVTLKSGHGTSSIPSKVLGYFAAGRAVIASVDSGCETARLVREAGAGVVVPPEDGHALAEAVLALREDRDSSLRMGAAGRSYLESTLSKDSILGRYEIFLRQFGRGAR